MNLFAFQLESMLAAIVTQTTAGVTDLSEEQLYFMGELLCAMSSDQITSLTSGNGFGKYWWIEMNTQKHIVFLVNIIEGSLFSNV